MEKDDISAQIDWQVQICIYSMCNEYISILEAVFFMSTLTHTPQYLCDMF